MGLELEYNDGQTPLDLDEKEGLLLKTITTHGELDEYEQLNIEKAVEWTITRSLSSKKILTEKFIKLLHKKMFGNVWSWAGSFRQSNKNIGIEWFNISVELKTLLDDARFWMSNNTYDPDEFAIRLKHRLVSIHCFPNGNGRHSRLVADTIIESIFGKEVFTWNNSNMTKPDETRKCYIAALKACDDGDILPLLEFARN
jgi:Fic-DOC domain mobile mystery protein B